MSYPRGVFGGDIASRDDFEYSAALQALPGTWTAEKLDAFLADPEGFAPGTAMRIAGIQNAEDRVRVVELLRNLE